MKKVLIVLALVALVLVPVAAKGAAAVGGEVGEPTGVTFCFKGEKGSNLYVTAGAYLGGYAYLDAAAGMEFKVAEFNIDKAKFNVNVGGQVGANIGLHKDYQYFAIAVRGTGSVSYDFSINNSSDWTAYIRLALGARFKISGEADGSFNPFSWAGVLGLVYHL